MKSEQPTLLILSPGFAKDEDDSTCLPTQQAFVRTIRSQFPWVKIIILSFEYPFSTQDYLWNQIQIIPFNGREAGKIRRLFLWRKIWRTMKKIKRENNLIGILSFWCTECAFVGKWFGQRNGIRHFSWISGQDAKKENKYVRFIRPKPEELIAMSDFLQKEFYKNHLVKPKYVVPNGIDPSSFILNNVQRNIDLMAAGSLIPLKKFDVYLRIVKKLSQKIPTLSAILCGDGPEMENLKIQINELKISGHLTLIGKKAHEEVLQLMECSKVFLHPSSYEGFSTVCLEALYAGAHVISFSNPVEAWIRHWHIVKDEEEMMEKALELLQDPKTEYSASTPYLMRDSANEIMKLFG